MNRDCEGYTILKTSDGDHERAGEGEGVLCKRVKIKCFRGKRLVKYPTVPSSFKIQGQD